jgi:hypothetical protein
MPNCDFYALRDDALAVLDFVFAETGCRAYELASLPGQHVRSFASTSDVASAFQLGVQDAFFQLHSRAMGGAARVRRLVVRPERTGAPGWRESSEGWGLIQLYFGALRDGRITPSHTNHNSEKRALTWAAKVRDLGEPSEWNWDEVGRVSRSINRRIAQLARGKHGSRAVLPQAFDAVQTGRAMLAPNR